MERRRGRAGVWKPVEMGRRQKTNKNKRGFLVLNTTSHLWQKRGKGEFVKRHVGKSELAEAAAAHAPEQMWVKEAKHFWKIRKMVRENVAWQRHLF